jgi:uncharacterized membrane protein YccC
MAAFRPLTALGRLAERESLKPDLSRAIRATVAFMVPLLLAARGWLAIEVSFVALVAQNIAMVDVRGAYRLRLALLLAMTAVFTGSAALGALASGNPWAAILATVLVAICSGWWRHLSSDYGMSLAISSTLVFLIALSAPGGAAAAQNHGWAAFVGGLWGVALQVANWPFRPQHPLRRTVADSWLAVADLFEAMAPAANNAARQERVRAAEAALRTTLDKSSAALAAARAGDLRTRLEALNLAAARAATRVVALNTALEALLGEPEFASLAPALQPLLTALVNTSRTVALAVVSRQPAHWTTAEVRLRRLNNLLRVLRVRIAAQSPADAATAQLIEILRQIEARLPEIHDALRATIDRADERSAFSLELFDLHTLTLRPLASALNLTWRFDPALVRYTARLAVLLVFGVIVFKAAALPHGYWLPFTMIVVMQPDYGSTRQRAAQRGLGTLAGSLVASAVMWLHLPPLALTIATAATVFAFGYLVRRHYARAIFFVTLFIVLLTEASGPVTVAFTIERLASTVAGGALALLAAMFFWPVWERDRFPPLLAGAFRANRDFLRQLADRLARGEGYDAEAVNAKRRAEAANSNVFSSLQRMAGDPRTQRAGLENAATLANGNQRLTRALTLIALHLTPGSALERSELTAFVQLATEALDALARAAERGEPAHDQLETLSTALETLRLPLPPAAARDASAQRDHWVFSQLAHAATELSALLLATMEAAPARNADSPSDA